MAAGAGLRLYLLGTFRVVAGTYEVPDEAWRLRKARQLLKLLALAPGHRVHREQAMDLLWPDLDPAAAANNLHKALHALRNVLEPKRAPSAPSTYVHFEGEHISLKDARAELWVDVAAFEDAAARAGDSLEACAAAVALYGGDLLPEDRYEDWAAPRREALRATWLRLMLHLAQLHEARHDGKAAIETLERVVEREPFHEEAQAALMRLYAANGQRHRALRQFQTYKAALARDLGAEVDPATAALHRAILEGKVEQPIAPPAGPPRPAPELAPAGEPLIAPNQLRHLPVVPTRLIDREAERERIRSLLAGEGARLLTLIGPAGVGKTRLALAAAEELGKTYTDGVRFVDLSTIRDGRQVIGAVAQAFGWRGEDAAPLEWLLAFLREKSLLLVLDNCEQFLASPPRDAGSLVSAPDRTSAHDATPDVARLLESCPRLSVLATSREPLRVKWERELPLGPLSLPDLCAVAAGDAPADAVAAIAAVPSVSLFAERAAAIRPDFRVDEANARAVCEICVRLDGLPLAIELAAARTKLLPPSALLARLSPALDVLTTGGRDVPARHQTMRAAIEWSHDLLTEVEQEVFRRLAVFDGGFTLEAAESVASDQWAADGPPNVLDLVASLLDKNLLRLEPPAAGSGDATPRFRMLQVVQEFALERLSEGGEREALRRRHAAYYTELAEAAAPALHGPDQLAWLRRLHDERDNLRAALEWSTCGTAAAGALGLRLAGSLEWFWSLTGQLEEGRSWLERALEHGTAVPEDNLLRASALSATGYLAHLRNDFAVARRFHEQSLALCRVNGDPRATGRAASMLAFVALHQGDLETAARAGEEGLALCRAGGDNWCIAFALCVVAGVQLRAGEPDGAAVPFEEGLSRFRQSGDRWGIAWALHGLGQVALHQGQLTLAAARYQERLALCRALGHRSAEAHALDVLGTVARLDGDLERAEALFQESLALRREWCGWDRPAAAYLLAALAGTALGRHRLMTSRERVLEGLATLREAPQVEDQPSRGALAALLEAGAELCVRHGQFTPALRLAGTARWLREASRVPLPAPERERLERALAPALAAVGSGVEGEAYAAHASGLQALETADRALLADETDGSAAEDLTMPTVSPDWETIGNDEPQVLHSSAPA